MKNYELHTAFTKIIVEEPSPLSMHCPMLYMCIHYDDVLVIKVVNWIHFFALILTN